MCFKQINWQQSIKRAWINRVANNNIKFFNLKNEINQRIRLVLWIFSTIFFFIVFIQVPWKTFKTLGIIVDVESCKKVSDTRYLSMFRVNEKRLGLKFVLWIRIKHYYNILKCIMFILGIEERKKYEKNVEKSKFFFWKSGAVTKAMLSLEPYKPLWTELHSHRWCRSSLTFYNISAAKFKIITEQMKKTA